MSEPANKINVPPDDVSLMLRAHAELRCLSREVIPVLRQLETGEDLPAGQAGAAMAYLEVIWLQARGHALETDAAAHELRAGVTPAGAGESAGLRRGAWRFYEAVTLLRETVQARLEPLLSSSRSPEPLFVPQTAPPTGV